MDIEQLNKSQTILLTLLVSFVTSIATGIVTVTLMDQAPPAITRTIHQVVEKTVETVTPENQSATISKVVVVKESDVISDVVKQNTDVVTRIYKDVDTEQEGNEPPVFVGNGLFVDKSGVLITDNSKISNEHHYSIIVDKKNIPVDILRNKDNGVVYLKVADNEGKIFKTVFDEAKIAEFDSLKLGQTVVSLKGDSSFEVSVGIISSFPETSSNNLLLDSNEENISTSTNSFETKEEKTESFSFKIKTSLSEDVISGGTPIFDLKGNAIGINISTNKNLFIPLDFIKKDLEEISNKISE